MGRFSSAILAVLTMSVPIIMAGSDRIRSDHLTSYSAVGIFAALFMMFIMTLTSKINESWRPRLHKPGTIYDIAPDISYRVLYADDLDGIGWIVYLHDKNHDGPGECHVYCIGPERIEGDSSVQCGDLVKIKDKDGLRTLKIIY